MNENGEAESRSRTPSPLSRSSSRSSIGQSPARTSLLKRNQSLSAKQIRFYRNGDKYFVGLKLAVSSERYKEFFALLVELSNKLELKTGAVRFVFDADTGRLITDVGQLNPNSSYVCSSSNNFKEIEGGYGQSQSKNWSTGSSRDRHELTNWQKSNLPRMDNKRDFIKPKLVTVVKNGKPPQKKVTMLLNKKTALDLNQVLDHLSSKGTLGKVDRLCSLSGREIKELRDLFEEDMIFIAFSSNERFPEEGFDVDVQSYKITPYRDLKRFSAGVKRTSSLRTPRTRRNTHESNNSSGGTRGRSVSPSSRTNGQVNSTPRSKLNVSKRAVNGGHHGSGEELYPAAVFQRENSDSDRNIQNSRKDRLSIHGFYKIGKIIGDGNFSVVRECRNRRSGQKYALKIVNKARVKGKEYFVEKESAILRQISHPNIVQLIEEYESSKEIFLVLELVQGGDLFDAIVQAKKYTERDASHMIGDLTSALSYLHDLCIIHRDIKPENLLVVNTACGLLSLKLADFGLATEVHEPQFLVCGTPTYVAPEILDESGYEFKADVWAAGVITYILLCGFPPFRSNDQEELFDMILSGDYEFLSPFWDEISQSAKDLIRRMLLVNPNERYSASESSQHPWIQGNTAKDTNLKSKLSCEINKNFQSKKKSQTCSESAEESFLEDNENNNGSCKMPIIDEYSELHNEQCQYRQSPSSCVKKKPRPKSLDFHMMGRRNEDYSQPDYELTQRNLLQEFHDEDEYY